MYTADQIWSAAVVAAVNHIEKERAKRKMTERETWLREKAFEIAASNFADQLFNFQEDPTRCSTYFLN